jgi:hypothetical protein
MLAHFPRQAKIILYKRFQGYSSLLGRVAVHIGVDTNISKNILASILFSPFETSVTAFQKI